MFLQRLAIFFRVLRIDLGATADLVDRRFQQRLARAGVFQSLAQRALVIERGEQEQLAGDELVLALLRQLVSEIEQACQLGADIDLAGGLLECGQGVQCRRESVAQARDVDAGLLQQGQVGRASCRERVFSSV